MEAIFVSEATALDSRQSIKSREHMASLVRRMLPRALAGILTRHSWLREYAGKLSPGVRKKRRRGPLNSRQLHCFYK